MKTRILLLLSVMFFLTVIISCVQERKHPVSAEMKTQIALLPQDAGVFGYVNIKRLSNAEFSHFFVDSAKKHLMSKSDFSDFVEQTGLDPEKDIREVYFAIKPDADKKIPQGLVVAKGEFDSEKIVKFLFEKEEYNRIFKEDYKGNDLYFIEEKMFAFCFANNQTLIGGGKEKVKIWLDKQQSGSGSVTAHKALLQELENMKYKEGMWLSLNPKVWKEQLKGKRLPDFKGLDELENMGFSLDITDKLQFSVRGAFTNTEKAKLFEEAIKGFVAAGKLSVSDEREVIDILNSIDVQADGNNVKVDFEINEQDAKKLIEKKKKISKKIFKAV